MIIISDLTGQLCNRIFHSAYGFALAENTDQTCLDFVINEYAHLFPATRRPRWVEWPYRLLRLAVRAVAKTMVRLPLGRNLVIDISWENTAEFSPGNPAFIARVRRRPLTFIRVVGLYFDLSKVTFPPSERIRQRFTPDPELTRQVQEQAHAARAEADVLVGVHIRRGDYASHLDGRHFYPFEFYRQAMDRVASFFPHQRVAFLLCSNEALPMPVFEPLQITAGPGTLLGDLYALAECDYLIGPPSTFSLWAAYYQRKPIYQMPRPELPASLDQFRVPDGHFECYDLHSK